MLFFPFFLLDTTQTTIMMTIMTTTIGITMAKIIVKSSLSDIFFHSEIYNRAKEP